MVLVSGTFSGTAHLGMMGHRILARASWPIVALMFGRTIGKFSNLGTESPGISAEQLSCWCCPREPRPCKAGSCPTRTWARGQLSCPLQGVYLEVGGVQGLGSRPLEITTVSLGCLEQAQSPHRSHSCPAAPVGGSHRVTSHPRVRGLGHVSGNVKEAWRCPRDAARS